MNLEFRRRSGREILDALTHPLGYRWSIAGAVVSVTHDGALVGKSNLLNTRIPRFRIGETSMHEASLALSLHLYFVVNPKSGGIAGDSPGGNLVFRVGPFDLKNATVRDLLNQIVSQPQWRLDRAATAVDDGERPWVWAMEGIGVRQDRCEIQPGTRGPRRGSASPLKSTGDKSLSLTMSAVSSMFSSALPHALREERRFALVDGFALSNLGSLLIVKGQELSPAQPSLRSPTAIMITCSNSLSRGSGMPNHYVGDLFSTTGISGRSRVRSAWLRQLTEN
jgi:hypothetical protein